MRFSKEELEKMTNTELVKIVVDLYTELSKFEKPVKRIITTNSPKLVQDYLKEVTNENR